MFQLKIRNAEYVQDYTIRVTFSDGIIKDCDLSDLVERDTHTLIKNMSFFKAFEVCPSKHGIVWNDDIDISEYYLFEIGIVKNVQ